MRENVQITTAGMGRDGSYNNKLVKKYLIMMVRWKAAKTAIEPQFLIIESLLVHQVAVVDAIGPMIMVVHHHVPAAAHGTRVTGESVGHLYN